MISELGLPDPAAHAGWADHPQRMGFFTDTSICIGCKACEVACKEWNEVPEDGLSLSGMSYDNTVGLGASTWRHVAFIEQPVTAAAGPSSPEGPEGVRWLMASDVCRHCTESACLDVCPTGALFRTEFGTVVVQDDVCNGCGTCVAGCPFGVVERRSDGTHATSERQSDQLAHDYVTGVAQKCTLCYDRLVEDQVPACAQTCPTTSIKFGNHDELVDRAQERVAQLHEQGRTEARLYGANERDGVGGIGSVFLLLDEPEVYGLPAHPRGCHAAPVTQF